MSSYVKITHEEFKAKMDKMGFHILDVLETRYQTQKQIRYNISFDHNDYNPIQEYVYFRNIVRDTPENMLAILGGEKPRYSVRIYSSVDVRDGVTRKVGKDAIRVMLWHNYTNRSITKRTIKRTQMALSRTHEKAREMWKAGAFPKPACPICDGVMSIRVNKKNNSKFWGCWDYPKCKGTWPTE